MSEQPTTPCQSACLPSLPVRAIICGGSDLQIGIVQGETFRHEIRQSIEVLASLEAVRLMKPFLIPHPCFMAIAERRANRFLNSVLAKVPVVAQARLQGIAIGANVPIRKLSLCAAMESILSDLTKVVSPAVSAGCTAVAITGIASKTDSPLLTHNFDYLPILQPFYFIRQTVPKWCDFRIDGGVLL